MKLETLVKRNLDLINIGDKFYSEYNCDQYNGDDDDLEFNILDVIMMEEKENLKEIFLNSFNWPELSSSFIQELDYLIDWNYIAYSFPLNLSFLNKWFNKINLIDFIDNNHFFKDYKENQLRELREKICFIGTNKLKRRLNKLSQKYNIAFLYKKLLEIEEYSIKGFETPPDYITNHISLKWDIAEEIINFINNNENIHFWLCNQNYSLFFKDFGFSGVVKNYSFFQVDLPNFSPFHFFIENVYFENSDKINEIQNKYLKENHFSNDILKNIDLFNNFYKLENAILYSFPYIHDLNKVKEAIQ